MKPLLIRKVWKRGIATLLFVSLAIPLSDCLAGLFNIDSPTAQVINCMGHPDAHSFSGQPGEEVWVYGNSNVTFRDGRVWAWDNRGHNLTVFMGSAKENAPVLRLGALSTQVIAALGTPDAIEGCEEPELKEWIYGSTSITLRNGRVVEWASSIPDMNQLPPESAPPKVALQLGTSCSQVKAVLGSPGSVAKLTNLGEEIWSWRESSITFKGGQVIGWMNQDDRLPVFLGCRKREAVPLGLGSSPEEVVACLGTPLEIIPLEGLGIDLWSYSYTTVCFRQGRVYSWNNLATRFVKKRIDYCLAPAEKLSLDSVASRCYPLVISPTRIPKANPHVTYPTPIMRDEQGCAWPYVAEDGSFYGENSTLTGQRKTVFVAGFFRADDTYVRSHYRSENGLKR